MKRFALFAMIFALAGCMDVDVPNVPPPSFRQFQPIYLNVSSIEMVEEYKSPMTPPNVEHLMPYSPADAMQIWVKQRLKATGGTKTMQVILKDASVVEKTLPEKGGLTGLVMSPDKQYDARLEVELRIYGDAALSEASVNVVSTQMLVMNDSLSAAERQLKFRQMANALMATTNAELEKNIAQYLSAYVNYRMNP